MMRMVASPGIKLSIFKHCSSLSLYTYTHIHTVLIFIITMWGEGDMLMSILQMRKLNPQRLGKLPVSVRLRI